MPGEALPLGTINVVNNLRQAQRSRSYFDGKMSFQLLTSLPEYRQNIHCEDKMTEGSRYGVNRSPLVSNDGHLPVAKVKCK